MSDAVYVTKRWRAEPSILFPILKKNHFYFQVGSPEAADIQVDFLHGSHGDGYPFDGTGGAVGHAFFPSDPARAGGVHLDAEEEWTFRQPGGVMFKKPFIFSHVSIFNAQ